MLPVCGVRNGATPTAGILVYRPVGTDQGGAAKVEACNVDADCVWVSLYGLLDERSAVSQYWTPARLVMVAFWGRAKTLPASANVETRAAYMASVDDRSYGV